MNSSSPVAIIVGASGRLGSRAAAGFHEAGYQVVGLDRVAANTPDWPVLEVNATDEDSVAAVFEQITKDHGHPHVVLQTVGMWAMAPFAETALQDWRTMMDVNLTSTFLLFRESLRAMQGSEGRLIGICSQQGSVRAAGQQAAYSASKAGVKRIVEAIAEEYAGSGITAHAVAPSMILFGGEDEGVQGVPVEDLVAHCLHLASDAGASLNGHTVHAFG